MATNKNENRTCVGIKTLSSVVRNGMDGIGWIVGLVYLSKTSYFGSTVMFDCLFNHRSERYDCVES